MKSARTFTATIYVGTLDTSTGLVISRARIERVCQRVADCGGLCVTVTPTLFIYKNGLERGAAIGLINYPRFPETRRSLRAKALSLASRLLEAMHQRRVSVVFPDRTVMLGGGE